MPEEIPFSPKAAELKSRLEKNPTSKLFLQLAEEYRRIGAREAALDVCMKGLERHPTYHTARVALGRIYLDLGRPEEASRELRKVLEATPDNILAGKLLGEALAKMGAVREALATLERIQAYDPGDKELLTRIEALKKRAASEKGRKPAAGAAPATPAAPARRAARAPAAAPAVPAAAPPGPPPEPPVSQTERGAIPFPQPDEGTAILEEPPSIEPSRRRGARLHPEASAPQPAAPATHPPGAEAPAPLAPPDAAPAAPRGTRPPVVASATVRRAGHAPELAGGVSHPVTHGLDEVLEQPAPEGAEETLQVTPSPDLLPADLEEEARSQVVPAAPPPPGLTAPQAGEPGTAPVEEGVVSRTLAEIYYRQGHLDRAVETLERLVLMDQAAPGDEARLKQLMAERRGAVFPHARSGEFAPGLPSPEEARDRELLGVYRRWLEALRG